VVVVAPAKGPYVLASYNFQTAGGFCHVRQQRPLMDTSENIKYNYS